MNNFKLENVINKKLKSFQYKDLSPNGLQIEGKKKVKKIVVGVTACQDLINKAIEIKADAIITHHGFFWDKENPILIGIKKKRIKSLLEKNINLYSWHLPLDIHKKLGNNAQLAKKLSINIKGKIFSYVFWGKLIFPMNARNLLNHIKKNIKCNPTYFIYDKKTIFSSIAWCSGKGQGYFARAINQGIKCFITGEISEETMHIAKENGANFYAIGHHISEKYGIKALGNWLKKKYALNVKFIDIFNPI